MRGGRTILASRIISSMDRQHAFLINRNKIGSMVLAGESLFVLEMQPASYAILATNEAEKAADIKVVDYRMIGATGRVYLSGSEADDPPGRDRRAGCAGTERNVTLTTPTCAHWCGKWSRDAVADRSRSQWCRTTTAFSRPDR